MDLEEIFGEGLVTDLFRIIGHLDRLDMPCLFIDDIPVGGVLKVSAHKPGDHILDTGQFLHVVLNAPEAAARKIGLFVGLSLLCVQQHRHCHSN